MEGECSFRCSVKDMHFTGWEIYHCFPVYSCGDYYYENEGQKICVDADFFEGQEWYVRLLLEGEDRLAKNRDSYCKGRVVSYHVVSEEWFLLASPALPPLEQLIEKEKILELMGMLTERQKDIVITYFYYGKTQLEISKGTWYCTATVPRRSCRRFAGCGRGCGSISNK